MVPKTKTTQILYRFEYSSPVLWVFGTIFIAILAIFLLIVRKNGNLFRDRLFLMPRKRRIATGIGLFLSSFLFAGLAILSLPVSDGKLTPDGLRLFISTMLSTLFVMAQTGGGMFLVSLVTEKEANPSETPKS